MDRKNNIRLVGLTFVLLLSFTSCNRGPKVISNTMEGKTTQEGTGIFATEGQSSATTDLSKPALEGDLHTVTALESLPTARYVYLRVKEGEQEFWIATSKMEVKIGGIYFFRDGLLKTDFESKEYNRVFDKMYLVSALVESDHGNHVGSAEVSPWPVSDVNQVVPQTVHAEGSVKIAELVANPKNYVGKNIQITGECVKVNPNIMGRHWIHMKDGSKDDYDLVITSHTLIPVGHTVTMAGKVALDKDFGSGYRFAILIEDCEVVK